MQPFKLRPSLHLTACLLILHIGAFFCLIFSNTTLWLKIITAAICLYSAWYTMYKYALLSYPKTIIKCVILNDGQWQLINNKGEKYKAFLLGDSWRSRWLLILNFKLVHSKKRVSILLCNDMLEQTIMRRLRVYLNLSVKSL